LNKQTLGIIGLIGGIIAMVSVALVWASASVTYAGQTISMSGSGIDLLKAGGEGTGMSALVLVGGILALVGGIGILAIKAVGYLLPLGGILALVGGIWAAARIAQAAGMLGELAIPGFTISVSIGYGIYVGIVGAVLALVGSLGLKGE